MDTGYRAFDIRVLVPFMRNMAVASRGDVCRRALRFGGFRLRQRFFTPPVYLDFLGESARFCVRGTNTIGGRSPRTQGEPRLISVVTQNRNESDVWSVVRMRHRHQRRH